MRRAYTIGAPSVFVNKNELGRFPEFRDQGVGGSNPLSPTNLLKLKSHVIRSFRDQGSQSANSGVSATLELQGLQLLRSEADFPRHADSNI